MYTGTAGDGFDTMDIAVVIVAVAGCAGVQLKRRSCLVALLIWISLQQAKQKCGKNENKKNMLACAVIFRL